MKIEKLIKGGRKIEGLAKQCKGYKEYINMLDELIIMINKDIVEVERSTSNTIASVIYLDIETLDNIQ